ncbi:MAG TPA: hypothetical protein PL182_01405 [Pseudobdellovibrionaceae bacterium]|nr:hypothetical protein [Pseudobdellovibrionaceae bacterium]
MIFRTARAIPLSLLTLSCLAGLPARAGLLLDLRSGTAERVEDVLSQGFTLLYMEEDCASCRRYLRLLKDCPSELTAKVRYVSTDPASRAKKWASSLPPGSKVYLMKDRKNFSFLFATPTTQTAKARKVGVLSCDGLEGVQP